MNEPVETHYHRGERKRLEAEAELGEVLSPIFTRQNSEAGLAAFLGWPVAVAAWISGIRRRRRSRKS